VSYETTDGAFLKVVRGEPSAVELAALVSVLAAKSAAPTDAAPSAPSMWGHPSGAVRRPLRVGPGGWRSSALPS
jgi:hypothetical protein